jgi:hypothetical protein
MNKKLLTKDSLWNIFVCNFIGKLIAKGMIVQIPTENSVSKYKNSGSVDLDLNLSLL